MASPNYSFEKRQRELAKKKKKEEKNKQKSESAQPDQPESGTQPPSTQEVVS